MSSETTTAKSETRNVAKKETNLPVAGMFEQDAQAGFQNMEQAVDLFDENDHNEAEFGMNRHLLFTQNNNKFPKLKLVS